MSKYDVALKSAFQFGSGGFLAASGIEGFRPSCQPIFHRRRTVTSISFLFKAECLCLSGWCTSIETKNDHDLSLRMLDYFCQISAWRNRKRRHGPLRVGDEIAQIVIYMGEPAAAPRHRCRSVESRSDIHSWTPDRSMRQPCSTATSPGDAIMAVLAMADLFLGCCIGSCSA
jgi:hypothetical protein